MEKISFDKKAFRFLYNEDAMAVEKTADCIRKFSANIIKLEKLVASMLQALLPLSSIRRGSPLAGFFLLATLKWMQRPPQISGDRRGVRLGKPETD